MAKRWQQSEISYLQRYGRGKPVEELARRFKTDAKTVKAKLAELAPARSARAKAAARPAAKPAAKPAARLKPAAKISARPGPKPAAKTSGKSPARPKAKAAARPAAKPPAKRAAKRAAKPAAKAPARPATTTATKPAAKAPAKPAATAAAKPAAKAPAKPAPMTPAKPTTPKAGPKTGSKTGQRTAAAPPHPPELPDPALTAYTEALKAMHKQDWAKAVKLFEKLAADEDRPEIAARARQYLAAARQRLDGEEEQGGHEDDYLKAVFEKNRGNLAAALEISRRGGRDKKDERFAYLVA